MLILVTWKLFFPRCPFAVTACTRSPISLKTTPPAYSWKWSHHMKTFYLIWLEPSSQLWVIIPVNWWKWSLAFMRHKHMRQVIQFIVSSSQTFCGPGLVPYPLPVSPRFLLLAVQTRVWGESGHEANTDQLTVLSSSTHTLKSRAGPGNWASVWHDQERDYRISDTKLFTSGGHSHKKQ